MIKILHKLSKIKRFFQNGINSGELKSIQDGIDDEKLKSIITNANPIILEIGAHDGGTSSRFLKIFPTAKIFCFEPDDRAIKKFVTRIGKDKRVSLNQLAISNFDGELDFYCSYGLPSNDPSIDPHNYPKGWDCSSSIKKPKKVLIDHPWCKFKEPIKIKSQKLDTWMDKQKIEIIDFIWADVQGAEKDLIEGATKTLKNVKYFYTEFANSEQYEGQKNLKEIKKLLPNFKILHIYKHDVLFKNLYL